MPEIFGLCEKKLDLIILRVYARKIRRANMGSGHCRACRFYGGQICSIRRNVKTSPGRSSGNWATYRA
jgi:hypothetical protein